MIGEFCVPTSLLWNVAPEEPLPYLPPRTQMVSPGLTEDGPFKAVCRSHGLLMLPSPPELPVVETYQLLPEGRTGGGGGAVPPWLTVPPPAGALGALGAATDSWTLTVLEEPPPETVTAPV